MPESRLTNSKLRIRTYEPAPPNFDPLTASQRELRRYGYPVRPDPKRQPDLLKRFQRFLSRKTTYITPDFRRTERRHKPPGKSKAAGTAIRKGTIAGPAQTFNWSGSVVFPPSGGSFGCIMGEWTVPNPYAVYQDGWYFASEWVGIDGFTQQSRGDVLQAGTGTDAFWVAGWKDIYAWWEWYPDNEVRIINFPVSSGDIMVCLITVEYPWRASVYLKNESNSVGTSFTITAPSGTSLVGDCAEWIVERPDLNGNITWLADFDAIYFDNGVAGYNVGSARTYVLSGSGTFVTMISTDGTGRALSVPIRETDELMKVVWEASR